MGALDILLPVVFNFLYCYSYQPDGAVHIPGSSSSIVAGE